MGGLLDSTNVVTPIVSVITSIAVDHASFLGGTIEQVATHKAGIIKKGIPLVTGPYQKKHCKLCNVLLLKSVVFLKVYGVQSFIAEEGYSVGQRRMKGEHQRNNAVIAIEALLTAGVPLVKKDVEQSVSTTQLAYRFQEVLPGVFLDGAHNPAAANALANTVRIRISGRESGFYHWHA